MGLRRLLRGIWLIVRTLVRWVSLLVLLFVLVYVTLPMVAQQDELVSTTIVTTHLVATTYSKTADIYRSIRDCTRGFRVIQNKMASIVYGTIQKLAEEFNIDVFREAGPRGVPISPANFLEFVDGVSSFVQSFVDILATPVRVILAFVIERIVDLDDGPLTFLLGIVDLLLDAVRSALDILGLMDDPPWSFFSGICRHRWDSSDEVPRNVVFAIVACIFPQFNPNADGVIDALESFFGFPIASTAYKALDALKESVRITLAGIFDSIAIADQILAGFFSTIEGLAGEINDAAGEVEDFFEDFFDLFKKQHNAPAIRERAAVLAVHYRREAELTAVLMQQLNNATTTEGPALFISREFFQHSPQVARNIRKVVRKTTAPSNRANAIKTWNSVFEIASAVFADPRENVPASHVRALYDSRSVDVIHLTGRDNWTTPVDARYIPIFGGPPPPIDVSGDLFRLLSNLILLAAVILALIALFPPTAVAALFFVLGSSIFMVIFAFSTITYDLNVYVDQFQDGKIAAPIVSTVAATALFLGKNYFKEGVIPFNPLDFIGEVAPYVEADAWFLGITIVRGFTCTSPVGLLFGMCFPPPLYGETGIEWVVEMARCRDGEPCTTVLDCTGRARKCSPVFGAPANATGECRCVGYVDIDAEVADIEVIAASEKTCRDFGYEYDKLLPRQTDGFSYDNVRSSFITTRAVVRDFSRLAAERKAVPPAMLIVYVLFFVPFLSNYGKLLGKFVVYGLIVQEGFYWSVVVLKFLRLDTFSFIANFTEPSDHGITCAVLNTPVAVMWIAALAAAYLIITLIIASGILGVIYRWVIRPIWWLLRKIFCICF